MRKRLLISMALILVLSSVRSQVIQFGFEKVQVQSGFRMDGYWVWGGSMITGVYDGMNSRCQPVRLKQTVSTDISTIILNEKSDENN